MLSYFNTVEDVIASATDMVILPIGSVEQHGSHLPLGTDYFIIKELSRRVAERINAFLLPPLPLSTCYEHKGKRGSVWMRPNTFYQMLQDIILCLKEQGFSKIIVMIGHGGIYIADPAIRELNALNDNIQVIKVNTFVGKKAKLILECDDDIHGGEKETSCMLYLLEEWVKKGEMLKNDFIPDCPREFLNYTSLLRISKTGIWGKSSLATKEKGEKLFAAMTETALEYIENAFSYTVKEAW